MHTETHLYSHTSYYVLLLVLDTYYTFWGFLDCTFNLHGLYWVSRFLNISTCFNIICICIRSFLIATIKKKLHLINKFVSFSLN